MIQLSTGSGKSLTTGFEQRRNSFVIVQVQPKKGGRWEMLTMYPTDIKTADPMFSQQLG